MCPSCVPLPCGSRWLNNLNDALRRDLDRSLGMVGYNERMSVRKGVAIFPRARPRPWPLAPLRRVSTPHALASYCSPIHSSRGSSIFCYRKLPSPWPKGGVSRLQREIVRDTLLLGTGMALFCLLVGFGGEKAMHLLFGPHYEGQGHTLLVLALAMLASALGMPASNALSAIERPHAIFWASLSAMVVTVVVVWFLMLKWGLIGAAYGSLAGNAMGASARWAAFLCLVQQVAPKQRRTPLPGP
jgi:hypothetical protein